MTVELGSDLDFTRESGPTDGHTNVLRALGLLEARLAMLPEMQVTVNEINVVTTASANSILSGSSSEIIMCPAGNDPHCTGGKLMKGPR